MLKQGEVLHPGVEDSVAWEQAKGTITDLVDAIVELITNSDDSYLTLELEGIATSGRIDIHIKRRKDAKLTQLKIVDNAAGMTKEKIEEIITYGKKTSAMYSGKTVRGFFGRGLKESIIAMGMGEIASTCNGLKTYGKYYYDHEIEKLSFVPIAVDKTTTEQSGTTITITATDNENIQCQTFETLKKQIGNHYALRDILNSRNRTVILHVEQLGYKKLTTIFERLKYTPPSGQQIVNRSINLKGFGIAHFKLYETNEKLNFQRTNPASEAGILIKTENATLDNQLFSLHGDPIANYFYGEIKCPAIAKSIKEGERGIVKPDRSGINWRHKDCKELEAEIVKILEHHIERRRKQQDAGKRHVAMPEERAAKFKKLFRKLNKLSRDLIGSGGEGPGDHPDKLNITSLTVIPTTAYAAPDTKRKYTVYNIAASMKSGDKAEISLDDPKGKFKLSRNTVDLKVHPKSNKYVVGYFDIVGYREQDTTGIIVKHGAEEDYVEFAVGPEKGKKPKGDKPKGRRGGLFKDISFNDADKQPLQRTQYRAKTGELTIYLNYPGIRPYLGPGGEGEDTVSGGMLLSELLAEAFCRTTARIKIEKEPTYKMGGEIDAYQRCYDDHLKECMPIIQDICLGK